MLYKKLIFVCILIMSICMACEKTDNEFPMDVNFTIEPSDPKTTDILKIKVLQGNESPKNKDLFYRWDWKGDSIWDTEFSSSSSINRRFYQPGSYNLNLQYSDGKGQFKVVTQSISISQGFSSPKADFSISPPGGNFTNEFVFDAGLTRDDEDSLDQLLFRWDFQGDGYWDTRFDTTTVVRKRFDESRLFRPILEVKDPSKLSSSISKELLVSRIDSLIEVNISWFPENIAVGDTMILDASSSRHSSDPDRDFQVAWHLPNNPDWTKPSYEKHLAYIFRAEGINQIGCKIIMDYSKLENLKYVEIFAAEENLPPEPAFEVSILYGNIHTQFYFNCWASKDDNLAPSNIFLRWDWDGDEVWDTEYSQEKKYYHQYSEPGVYHITLEAMDNFQVTAKTYGQITVSEYENPTSYFIDQRDGAIYGTVQIGNQTWMAENLRFEIPEKTKSGFPITLSLFEKEELIESFGRFYHITAVIEDRNDDDDDVVQVCPDSWHIPTKGDFKELFEAIGGQGQGIELITGGSSDFNGLFLGYGDYHYKYIGRIIVDTIFTFHETYENMYLMSSSMAEDTQRTDSYLIKVLKESRSLWEGYTNTRFYTPIRCIKD